MTHVDEKEFRACWARNAPRVETFAARQVGRAAAPDILQATFLTAWQKWRDVPHDPLPWLYTVARGHIRNWHRSERRRGRATDVLRTLQSVTPATEDPDHRRAALAALARLPEADREALLLVAWDGLSNDDAARVVGCRPGTFRTRLHRARARLQSEVDAYDPTEEKA